MTDVANHIRPAIDTVLRETSLTTALPDWYPVSMIDHSKRTAVIEQTVENYSRGGNPTRPFPVNVPRRSGAAPSTWLQPSLNDQIVLHACVSSFARTLEGSINRKRVFSYRHITDPNSPRWLEDQCAAWTAFKEITSSHARSCGHVLVLDLTSASSSIDQNDLVRFLSQFSTGAPTAITVVKQMISSWVPGGRGLPLMNDTLFYLANAYYTKIDRLLTEHSADFVRFNDDYCVFDRNPKALEDLYRQVHVQLPALGFAINESKVRLLNADAYCDRLTTQAGLLATRIAVHDEATDSRYATVADELFGPEAVQAIDNTLKAPGKYLNDGLGRAQLGSLRKIRALRDSGLAQALQLNQAALTRSLSLLATYATAATELWRGVWLLYLLRMLAPPENWERSPQQIVQALNSIERRRSAPLVTRLWATGKYVRDPQSVVDQLAESDYLSAGKACFGEKS